ncbi:MAG: hypothetical protein KVP17_002165 [Porospora cf. gigantea B]|uniref:uncharacterized protein n=1 Tax=Porospora cf. gigantea B TaxID=2853592 RepID=UPI003571F790|nr:MAG: hypothetical protein KVP17_002165 [Porospora cf. gigantea B]
MGKKAKVGKERLDKFYHLAKEQGFRARSAFKLIQLGQKFNLFDNASKVLDLCAAPGGWLQVCQKEMRSGSTIVGVDLAPIRALRGVVSIQADITTERCRKLLRKELSEGECDLVLHDGAPNVGTSWAMDAYNQNELVLHSVQLASEYLKRGGVFVSKIFRSQDYNSLIWVFKQLFNRVSITKPSSSRAVSAECFAVCEGYKKPGKIDPRFFDPKYVFVTTQQAQEAGQVDKNKLKKQESLAQMYKEREKKKRSGYAADETFFHKTTIAEFFDAKTPSKILMENNMIVFEPADNAFVTTILDHPTTDLNIKALLADLKLCSKKDLNVLLRWREKLNSAMRREEKSRISILRRQAEEDVANLADFEEFDIDAVTEQQDLEDEREDKQEGEELDRLIEARRRDRTAVDKKERARKKKAEFKRMQSLGGFDNETVDTDLFTNVDMTAYKTLKLEEEVLDPKRFDKYLWDGETHELSDVSLESSDSSEGEGDDLQKREDDLALTMKLHADTKAKLAKLKTDKGKKLSRRERVRAGWADEVMDLDQYVERASRDAWHQKAQAAVDSEEDDEQNDIANCNVYGDDSDEERFEDMKKRPRQDNETEPAKKKKRVSFAEIGEMTSDADSVVSEIQMEEEEGTESAYIAAVRKAAKAKLRKVKPADENLAEVNVADVNEVSAARFFTGDLFTKVLKTEEAKTEAEGFDLQWVDYSEPVVSKEGTDAEQHRKTLLAYQRRKKAELEKQLLLLDQQRRQHDSDDSAEEELSTDEEESESSVSDSEDPLADMVDDIPSLPLSDKKKAKMKRKEDAKIAEAKAAKQATREAEALRGLGAPLGLTVEGPKDTFEEVAIERPEDPNELAGIQSLGHVMMKKSADVLDGAYNRFAFNDDYLPDWFMADEAQHTKCMLPITKELNDMYKAKLKEINSRPIRKAAEAKGRKRRKYTKLMTKVNKKAHQLADAPDVSEADRVRTIRKMIRSAKRSTVDKKYLHLKTGLQSKKDKKRMKKTNRPAQGVLKNQMRAERRSAKRNGKSGTTGRKPGQRGKNAKTPNRRIGKK